MNDRSFIFAGYDADVARGEAAFHFAIEGKERLAFTEKIFFSPVINQQVPEVLLLKLFENLLLILGISYWKLSCPKTIKLPTVKLTKDQALFWNTVYTKGLGEFFYKNNIDFRGLVEFPHVQESIISPVSFPRQDRSLLPLGGGKDSIVAAEMMNEQGQGKPFDLFSVNTSNVQQKVAEVMGKTPMVMKRELDPKLFALNGHKDTYNGHIPISAVYAFVSLLAAILYDYRSIVLSNEKSANYGNVEYLGETVNHQWSKSEEFEKLFQTYVANFITADIQYYSLLRALTELEITEQFVKYKKYFKVFSSCNRNFTLNNKIHLGGVQGHLRGGKPLWCGKCPKCAFVFAILAAFLSKDELLGIFGKNLFADQALLPLYKELLGIENFKPFECVGTPEEVKEAFSLASKRGEYKDDSIMQFFMKQYET